MTFDETELDLVVMVLQRINPQGYDDKALKQTIKDNCHTYLPEGRASYFSTLGFVATGYMRDDEWRCKVSISAWSVEDYFRKVSQ